MKKRFLVVLFVITLILGLVWIVNYVLLQTEMASVIESDHRNEGIAVRVHYGAYLRRSVLVYDLRAVPGTSSEADVFRVFLQFADRLQSRNFDTVRLECKGKPKFVLDGDYFQKIGEEYSWQNPVYTMRTFPENLKNPDGTKAFSSWTGGLLGVLGEQMDDFNDFHREWYIDELAPDY